MLKLFLKVLLYHRFVTLITNLFLRPRNDCYEAFFNAAAHNRGAGRGHTTMKIVVKDRQEAFKVAGELFPTDYEIDRVASANAGYDIYRHIFIEQDAWISDLGSRLEVNVNGKTTNIWVESEPIQETDKNSVGAANGYTAITLKSCNNTDGKKTIWKDVVIDTDHSFKALKDRHYKRHGINYESMYIVDANGETVYSHAGMEE